MVWTSILQKLYKKRVVRTSTVLPPAFSIHVSFDLTEFNVTSNLIWNLQYIKPSPGYYTFH
jgi:hypothetical protein